MTTTITTDQMPVADALSSGAPRTLAALAAAAVWRGWDAAVERDGEVWTLTIGASSDSRTGRYSWASGRWAGNTHGYRETLAFYVADPAGTPGAPPVTVADAAPATDAAPAAEVAERWTCEAERCAAGVDAARVSAARMYSRQGGHQGGPVVTLGEL